MAARESRAGGAGPEPGPSAGAPGEAAGQEVHPGEVSALHPEEVAALRPEEVSALHPEEVSARLQRMRRELSNRRKILVKNLPQDSSCQVLAPGRGDGAGAGDTERQESQLIPALGSGLARATG